MSTNYIVLKPKISFEQLRRDIKSDKVPGSTPFTSKHEKPDSFCITDGTSFLWVTGKGNDYCLDRYGFQSTIENVIEHLESHIQCQDIIDEYDERYNELMED